MKVEHPPFYFQLAFGRRKTFREIPYAEDLRNNKKKTSPNVRVTEAISTEGKKRRVKGETKVNLTFNQAS